jgi:uncharacterized protein
MVSFARQLRTIAGIPGPTMNTPIRPTPSAMKASPFCMSVLGVLDIPAINFMMQSLWRQGRSPAAQRRQSGGAPGFRHHESRARTNSPDSAAWRSGTSLASTTDMTTATLEAKVQDFLAQKRIAVAGVSRDKRHHPVGNLIYDRLQKSGHDVFAVNPQMQTFECAPCYPDVQSIAGGVDGVVIVTRPEKTTRIVRDCGAAGVRRVWMHQSMGKGTSVSPEAVEYCRQHDISVIAGACPMMYGPGVDIGHACMRWILKLTGGLPE